MWNELEISSRRSGFVLPSGLDRAAPREVRLTAWGRVTLLVAVLLFLAAPVTGGLMLRASLRGAEERRVLQEQGIDTTAEIVRVWRRDDESEGQRAAYQYVAGGQIYRGEARIREAGGQQVRVGAPIPVRYLPTRPEQHQIAGRRGGAMPLWVPPLVSSMLLALGVCCVLAIRRQQTLLMFGRAAPALVRNRTKTQTSHGSLTSITYEFPLLSGATATGRTGASKETLAMGAVISVIYDRDESRRNRPYPFGLVQLGRR